MRFLIFISTLVGLTQACGQNNLERSVPLIQKSTSQEALPLRYSNRTQAQGLGSNFLYSVYASGSNVYAATSGGLSSSTDGGQTFTTQTTANGLASNFVYSIAMSGSTIYAATNNGLSVSADGGAHWTTMTTANGLPQNSVFSVNAIGMNIYASTFKGLAISTDGGGFYYTKTKERNGLASDTVFGVFSIDSALYVATASGISISTDGGDSFTTKTIAPFSQDDNYVQGLYVSGATIYAATRGGVAISTDGGNHFEMKTIAHGLGSNNVNGVFVSGSTIYAATAAGLSVSYNNGVNFSNIKMENDTYENNFVSGVTRVGNVVYAATRGGLAVSVQAKPHTCYSFDTKLACFVVKRGGPEVMIEPNKSLTFISMEDSRCSLGSTCIWAGKVKANFRLSPKNGTGPSRMISLELDPRQTQSATWVDGATRFTIQLLEVSSDINPSNPLDRADYAKIAVGYTDLGSTDFMAR